MRSFEMEPASGPRFQVRTTSSRVMIEVKDNWVALLPGEAIQLSEMLMGRRSYTDTEEFRACNFRPWHDKHWNGGDVAAVRRKERRLAVIGAPNNLKVVARRYADDRALVRVTRAGLPAIDCDLTHLQAATVANWLLLCAEDLGDLPELFPDPDPEVWVFSWESSRFKKPEPGTAAHAAREIKDKLNQKDPISDDTIALWIFLGCLSAAATIVWVL